MITAAFLLISGIGLYLLLTPPWENIGFFRFVKKPDPLPKDASYSRTVTGTVPGSGMIPIHSSYRFEADMNE